MPAYVSLPYFDIKIPLRVSLAFVISCVTFKGGFSFTPYSIWDYAYSEFAERLLRYSIGFFIIQNKSSVLFCSFPH